MHKEIWNVLRNYHQLLPGPVEISPLGGAGGFSGAQFWRIRHTRHVKILQSNTSPFSESSEQTPPLAPAGSGNFCLRRWPQGNPTEEKLCWIYRVLCAAHRRGTPVALPEKTREGGVYVADQGFLWELAPWMPGQAETETPPSKARLTAAMQMLATFHVGAAEIFPPQELTSPGLQERLALLRRVREETLARLHVARAPKNAAALERYKDRLLAHVRALAPHDETVLARAAQIPLGLQPCIRDIHPQHVLFLGDKTSGLIDFGAMRNETIAGDIARLLGGYCADDQPSWKLGLEAYEQVRPLSENERRLIPVFDASGILLSGVNWLRWIYLEGRTFENLPAIGTRLQNILARLEHMRMGREN